MISQTRIVVRYAETDQMGIAHHASYPVWYEVARTDLVRHLGLSYAEMEELGLMLPLVDLSCHYISPARYDDELIVEAAMTHLSRVRMQIDYTVHRVGESKPINTGRTVHAMVNRNLRPINVQKQFPALFARLESAVEEISVD